MAGLAELAGLAEVTGRRGRLWRLTNVRDRAGYSSRSAHGGKRVTERGVVMRGTGTSSVLRGVAKACALVGCVAAVAAQKWRKLR